MVCHCQHPLNKHIWDSIISSRWMYRNLSLGRERMTARLEWRISGYHESHLQHVVLPHVSHGHAYYAGHPCRIWNLSHWAVARSEFTKFLWKLEYYRKTVECRSVHFDRFRRLVYILGYTKSHYLFVKNMYYFSILFQTIYRELFPLLKIVFNSDGLLWTMFILGAYHAGMSILFFLPGCWKMKASASGVCKGLRTSQNTI